MVEGASDIKACNTTLHLIDAVLSPIELDLTVLERAALEEVRA